MPDAVNAYKENNNLQDVMAKQQEIIRLYRKDISQYDEARQLSIKEVLILSRQNLTPGTNALSLKTLMRRQG